MKTILLNKPEDLRLVERDFDANLAANEALLKIHRIGICGTDYHAFRGKQPFFSYPRVLGHELGVEVLALGSEVDCTKISVGDRASVEPYLNCGFCQPCRVGKSNCCENLKVLGVHIDGGMAEFLKIPANKLHRSAKLSYEQLALVETLGIGSHAVQRGNVSENDLVLVIGAGPIGLAVAQFVKLKGAKIAMMDTNKQRLDFAENLFGIDYSVLANVDFDVEKLRNITKNELPTVVFDATGNAGSMMKAFSYLAFGGKLVYVGLFQGEVTFFDPDFHRKEVTLMASRNALPQDFEFIIEKMENGEINTQSWLSHSASFNELPTVFSKWLLPETQVIKSMVYL